MAACCYCNKQIKWRTIGKKRKPFNLDGSRHHCPGLIERQTRWKKDNAEMLKYGKILDGEFKAAVDRHE